MGEIKIKDATIGDAKLIADISRQTFYETFAAVNTKANMDKFMDDQFTKELLIKEVEERDGIFFLAYEDEKAVGYARMREGDSYAAFKNNPAIEIVRIYALQTAIGKGVGKALIQQCMEEAKRFHKKIIWLGVWEKNERALAFYAKWGFEKFGEHEFLLGDDLQTDWLLMREL